MRVVQVLVVNLKRIEVVKHIQRIFETFQSVLILKLKFYPKMCLGGKSGMHYRLLIIGFSPPAIASDGQLIVIIQDERDFNYLL